MRALGMEFSHAAYLWTVILEHSLVLKKEKDQQEVDALAASLAVASASGSG